eukprot:scaffold133079_cov53-Prasinocladus_malaysianus.AAC.1
MPDKKLDIRAGELGLPATGPMATGTLDVDTIPPPPSLRARNESEDSHGHKRQDGPRCNGQLTIIIL